MRRRLRLAVAVLIVGASAAGTTPALGAPFTPQLDRAYSVAVRFWHREPTNCTSIDREILGDAEMPEGAEGWATFAPAAPTPCVLWIDRTLAAPSWFPRACAVMIHEVGHLLGFQHSSDPANVMYPEVVRVPGICGRAALRELNRRAPARARSRRG